MNVKKGDLAIVIRSVCGNEGRIVKVLEWLPEMGRWMVEGAGGPLNGKQNGKVGKYDQVACLPSQLRPISGLPDAEDTDEREPIKELA